MRTPHPPLIYRVRILHIYRVCLIARYVWLTRLIHHNVHTAWHGANHCVHPPSHFDLPSNHPLIHTHAHTHTRARARFGYAVHVHTPCMIWCVSLGNYSRGVDVEFVAATKQKKKNSQEPTHTRVGVCVWFGVVEQCTKCMKHESNLQVTLLRLRQSMANKLCLTQKENVSQ